MALSSPFRKHQNWRVGVRVARSDLGRHWPQETLLQLVDKQGNGEHWLVTGKMDKVRWWIRKIK